MELSGQDLVLGGYFLIGSILATLNKTVSFFVQLFKDTHQFKKKKEEEETGYGLMQQFRRVFGKWILKRENAFVENVLTTQKITAFAEQMGHKNHEEIDL